jgi:hypothetical protein
MFHRKDPFMESTDRFMGKKLSEVLPPEAANLAFSAIREAAEDGFQRTSIHLRKEKWCVGMNSAAPMKETDEHDTHFICLSRDITKVKADESLAKRK